MQYNAQGYNIIYYTKYDFMCIKEWDDRFANTCQICSNMH